MAFGACATGDQNADVAGLADAGLGSTGESAGADALGNPSTSGASTGTDIGASGAGVGTSGIGTSGVGTTGSLGTSGGAGSGSPTSGASSGSFTSGVAASGSATGSSTGSATSGSATAGSASGSADGGTGGNCKSNVLAPTAATALSQMQPAANAIDGKFNTYWESTHGVDLEWIDLDFGAPVFVNRVEIAWGASCAVDYTLAVSNNKMTWTTIKTITGNAMGTAATAPPTDWATAMPVDSPGLSGVGRYLRVNATKRCSIHGYAIWEMRAFGDTNAACTP